MSDDAMQARDEMTGEAKPRKRTKPVYDQAFFLDLARPREDTAEARTEARERWNAWRRDPANEKVWVTFEGVDFRTKENLGISFDGFEFGDWARFSRALFPAGAEFRGATFGDSAEFDGTLFHRFAFFNDATFGDHADFNDATFAALARFNGTSFGEWANFVGATLGDSTFFAGATFGDWASFAGATGERDVEAWQRGWAALEEAESGKHEKVYRMRREAEGFGPAKFSSMTFAGAHFRGSVSFARRSFERSANFTNVRFDQPPDFDGATNLQRIDFTGARAGFSPSDRPWWKPDWTTRSRIAVRLRSLRSQIEATKNHDFERDLYIEERKAERGIHLARLWDNLRPRRLVATALAYIGGLPRLPKVDIFAERGDPVVRWPQPPRNRRVDARPAMIGDGPAAVRIRRAYRRNGARFLAALGPLLGHLLWIAVMAVYWALSDYGRSWLRPAVWLGASIPVFDVVYARVLADRQETAVKAARDGVTQSLGNTDALAVVKGWQTAEARVRSDYDAVVGQLAVSNAVPFVGPLTVDADAKKFLFCGVWPAAKAETGAGTLVEPCRPIPPPYFQFAMISQNLLSILLVFFIGLALRNYFRLK